MKCAFEMLNDIVALRAEDEAKREQERLEEIRKKREREAFIQKRSDENKTKLFDKITSNLLTSKELNTTLELAVHENTPYPKTLVAFPHYDYYSNGRLTNTYYESEERLGFYLEDIINDLTKLCYKVSVEKYEKKVWHSCKYNYYHMAPMIKLTVSIDPQCIALIS